MLGSLALVVAAGLGAAAFVGAAPADSERTSAGARWTRLPTVGEAPSPRRDHSLTVAVDTGLIYLFGGRSGRKSLDDLWVFDPRTSRWSEVEAEGDKPRARFAHNAFYDARRRRLVVAMGQGEASFLILRDVWAFDPRTRSWTELGKRSQERPEERYGAAGAYDRAGDRFLLSHGFKRRGSRFDDTWAFDLEQDSWAKVATRGAVPIERCLTSAFWDSKTGRFSMFGGQTDAVPFLGDFWSLDPKRGAWSRKRLSPLPSARSFYASAFDDRTRRWLVFGGNTPRGPARDTWSYDAARGRWSRVAASGPPARESAQLALAGGRAYLVGGSDGSKELGDVWVLRLGG